MRLKLLSLTLAFGLTGLFSQGPMYDTVIVNLPHPVTVRGTVLEPGEYQIKQMQSASNTRVLHIYGNRGMHLETTVMTIPALDNKTPEDTKVTLHNFGDTYYFDKVWVQGKNYGYEFPLPDDAKSRMRERSESFTVAAKYEPQTTTTTTTTTTDTTVADREREAQAERDRQAQAERDRLAQAERDRLAQEERDRLDRERQAQADRDRLAQEERDRLAQAERDRLAQQQQQRAATTTQELPATSANWLGTLLVGTVLIGAGLKFRRS